MEQAKARARGWHRTFGGRTIYVRENCAETDIHDGYAVLWDFSDVDPGNARELQYHRDRIVWAIVAGK